MASRLLSAAAFGLGLGAGMDGLQLYAPMQPAVQQQSAVQSAAFLAYQRPVDAIRQPVVVEMAAEQPSNPVLGALACVPLGFLGYALARYATKPAAGIAPAASSGPLVTAPAAGAFPPTVAMAAVSGRSAVPTMKAGASAITSGDIGTTKPLGVYDPLQLMQKMPDKYRRWQEMEIKHGRFAMAACLHVFVTEAGFRWPGYLSIAEDIKFTDMPGGTIASWAALPNLAWAQIVLIVALFDNSVLSQDPDKKPGDVGGPFWVRYEDKPGQSGLEWKLNAERNNGRAAMMGILGMIIHEGLTGNPVWPIPVPVQPVLEDVLDDVEKGPARVGSFVLVSLGMTAAGIIAAIPEFGKQDQKA